MLYTRVKQTDLKQKTPIFCLLILTTSIFKTHI